ncbi:MULTISPECIES: ABC transporter ATP-binding protein [Bacillus]|uniref:ABC transporter ATP-binding protein n=1 Tax=Bacillus TaxID=1386 RepID=UPI0004140284|nr:MULTISPECIES: ABC transporter ATP-binding protein [Bacillus]WFA04221.1 ABC transporter ATP-binding protein [Bacillus sp. HSf4]
MDILKVKNLSKVYNGKVPYQALSNIGLTVKEGEFVGIMGPSGSGKTTFLNVISTIDTPDSGDVLINGENVRNLSKKKLALFRRRELGFVFQDFNLLKTLTVIENIVLPLTLEGTDVKEMEERAVAIAKKLGIGHILNKRTYEISGGQSQRTAIARAIIHQPKLILADEPTGNLDSKSAKDVLEILKKINREDRVTMMMVTHDPLAASYCDRIIFIKDGTLYNEIYKEEDQQAFFNRILTVLSAIGGNKDELSPTGVQ